MMKRRRRRRRNDDDAAFPGQSDAARLADCMLRA